MLITVGGDPKFVYAEISGNNTELAEVVNIVSAGMRVVECSSQVRADMLNLISKIERLTQARIHGKENEKIFTP